MISEYRMIKPQELFKIPLNEEFVNEIESKLSALGCKRLTEHANYKYCTHAVGYTFRINDIPIFGYGRGGVSFDVIGSEFEPEWVGWYYRNQAPDNLWGELDILFRAVSTRKKDEITRG